MSPIRKVLDTLCKGWVIEYPDSRNGPRDFFDNRDRAAYTGRKGTGAQEEQQADGCALYEPRTENKISRKDESEREDDVFKWREQMLRRESMGPREEQAEVN